MKLSRRNFVKFLGCSAAMLALPNVSAMAVSKTTIGAPAEMVDVLVPEDTAHLIYASVPKSLAGEYQARLKNDKAFLEQQTTEALGSSVRTSRTLPDGPIEFQSYLYESDIEAAVDAAKGEGTFFSVIQNAGGVIDAALALKLVKLAGYNTFSSLAVAVLLASLSAAAQEREEWWTQAEIDILKHVISAVRYTIVQNMNSEYPKVWRVFERIS